MNHDTVLLLKSFHPEPLAIDPQALNALLAMNPEAVIRRELQAEPEIETVDGTAFIPVIGFLAQRPSLMMRLFGGTSMQSLQRQLSKAADTKAVKRIVLDMDSGGGSVYAIHETARLIREIRRDKRVIAHVNAMAASAAYWLASAASEIAITPSGQAGSIGVLSLHVDHSEQLSKAGIKPTYIHAAKYKTEGNPYEPLKDEARRYIQSMIDGFYTDFISDVALGRSVTPGKVTADFGQGRLLRPREAVRAGLVDRIAADQTLLTRQNARLERAKAELDALETPSKRMH